MIFEDGWVNWVPRSTGLDGKVGIRRAMTKILEAGALDASPSSRPKTIEAAKELLGAVRDLYEVERKKEED